MKIEAQVSSGWSGWITPGGGMEEEESEESAFRREIKEELGLEDFDIAGKVWKRRHHFEWNKRSIDQDEVFFLVHINQFTPKSVLPEKEKEELGFKEFKWWNVDEIQNSTESFAPRKLGEELKDLVLGGLPQELIDVGI